MVLPSDPAVKSMSPVLKAFVVVGMDNDDDEEWAILFQHSNLFLTKYANIIMMMKCCLHCPTTDKYVMFSMLLLLSIS